MKDYSLDDFSDGGDDSQSKSGKDSVESDTPVESDTSAESDTLTESDTSAESDTLTESDTSVESETSIESDTSMESGDYPAEAGVSFEGEPPTPASRWDRTGEQCEDCKTTVNRRWNDAGRLVCRECKDWS